MDPLIELNQGKDRGGSQSGGFLPTGKRTALKARHRARTKVRKGDGARGAAAAHRNLRTAGPGTLRPWAGQSMAPSPRKRTKGLRTL